MTSAKRDTGQDRMKLGVAMFFTDYSMTPQELAVAAEDRGFDSVWSPEHSHIPLSRESAFPSGGDLPKKYYDAMDPFVALMAAAAVTKTIQVGTGVCLVVQRDPIQTAKHVASIDQLSNGRFLFGVGNGWNKDEMRNHGTGLRDPPQARPRAHRGDEGDLGQVEARVSRRAGQLRPDDDLAQAGAEAAPADPGRRRLPVRCAPRHPLRRRLDAASRAGRTIPTCATSCPSSARWPPPPTATCRSPSGARKTRTC
jgi:hypothetical protein